MGIIQDVLDTVKVPEYVKQRALPFGPGAPTKFTYKTGEDILSICKLGICPKEYERMKDDVGIQKIGTSFSDFLDNLPSIQIMEKVQDTRIQEVTTALSMLPKGYKVGKDLYNSADNFGDRLKNIGVFAKKLLVELIQEDWFADGDVSKVDLEDNYKKLFLKVPYTLYYRMIGTEILNCYELPCDVRQLTRSVSSVGWSDQDSDFGLVGSMNSSSFLGKMMNWLGGGMAIRLQPRWNPQDTAPQSLQVSFYLFNDEVQRSVNNFIFLNTIMPGAMSMQWGICKHSPNLYDVKISGYTRMFLCSCDISVTMKGQIRKPSESFFQTLSKWSAIRQDFATHDLIRIPDIYEVTLSFKSLVPDNLNNFFMQFSEKQISELWTSGGSRTQGVADKFYDKVQEIVPDVEKAIEKISNGTLTGKAIETEANNIANKK